MNRAARIVAEQRFLAAEAVPLCLPMAGITLEPASTSTREDADHFVLRIGSTGREAYKITSICEWIAVAHAARYGQHFDAEDVEHTLEQKREAARRRYWRPSLPVIHLAIALRSELLTRGDDTDIGTLLLDPTWLPRLLKQAEDWRLYLETQLQIPPCIRLIPENE